MSLTTIRAEIKSKLDSISSIGKVHDYRRWTTNWDDIATFFKDANDRINGWFFELASMDGVKTAMGSIAINRRYVFRLWGLYSMKDDDETAKAIENIVEDVANEFDATQALGSTGARWFESTKLIGITDAMFSNLLVHKAEVLLSIEELVAFNG